MDRLRIVKLYLMDNLHIFLGATVADAATRPLHWVYDPKKLNLIEFNPLLNKDFKPATQENINKFSKTIQDAGFLSLFSRSRGRDIKASCGSLANSKAILNG